MKISKISKLAKLGLFNGHDQQQFISVACRMDSVGTSSPPWTSQTPFISNVRHQF